LLGIVPKRGVHIVICNIDQIIGWKRDLIDVADIVLFRINLNDAIGSIGEALDLIPGLASALYGMSQLDNGLFCLSQCQAVNGRTMRQYVSGMNSDMDASGNDRSLRREPLAQNRKPQNQGKVAAEQASQPNEIGLKREQYILNFAFVCRLRIGTLTRAKCLHIQDTNLLALVP
jgi:hypothetical protein